MDQTPKLPAIGISYIAQLGGDRQMTLQTFVAREDSPEAANRVIDHMIALGERQKARFDLDREEEQFHLKGAAIENMIRAIPHAEENHRLLLADKLKAIGDLEAKSEAEIAEGYDEHALGGRKGSYSLTGARKQRVEGMARDLARHKADVEKAEAERSQFLQNQEHTILHHQTEFLKMRSRINNMRSTGGLPPIEGYDLVFSYGQD